MAPAPRPGPSALSAPDLLRGHQPRNSAGVRRTGMEDVEVGDDDVARRSGELDDPDGHAVDLGRGPYQGPVVLRPAGAVEQPGQPRIGAQEPAPVLHAGA